MTQMTRTIKTFALLLALLLAVAAPAAATAQDTPNLRQDKKEVKKKTKKKKKKNDDKKKGENGETKKKKDEAKPFDEVVKEMEKIEGLFTFYRDDKEGKVLLEILPGQFGADFIYSSKIEQGTGERGFYGTIMMNEFIFQFRKQGKRVQMIQKNTAFTAESGSPSGRAVEHSFSDSMFGAAKILSKPHEERGSVLIDLGEIFLGGDLHGLGNFLKNAYGPGYKFAKDDSAFVLVKSFPKNSEIGTLVRFQASGPMKQGSRTIPDARNLTARFRYSLAALPDNDYTPRLADDRVGYFTDSHMDFTSDKEDSPYVHYIHRWKLVKKDPAAELSEPVEPIVFWLENTVPEEYRDPLREGVLFWNKAFEAAGFKNAIVVKQQPDDAEWDPADIRYNTIRWFVGYDARFAIGPSHANLYTGQILDADIGFSDGLVRSRRRNYQRFIHPVQAMMSLIEEPQAMPWEGNGTGSTRQCRLGEGLAQLSSFALDVLSTRPGWDAAREKEYMRQFVAMVSAHEVGHTLGLRHNFRASQINSLAQLNDTDRTKQFGQVASVMDYAAPFIALKDEKQGDYYTRTAGAYDLWAIEYGYKPVPGAKTARDELPELKKIASRAADPMLPYATDEDAGYNARALDPRNNHWDNASEPLEYFDHQIQLVHELWRSMEEKLLLEGENYTILRLSFANSWGPHLLGSLAAMKYIGGIYHHRDYVGDPDGRLPFEPVPAEKQREALRFLAEKIWAPGTFDVPAGLLNKLQLERQWDFNATPFATQRIDYPLHSQVMAAQTVVLGPLYHPLKLQRLQDLEKSNPLDPFTMAEMFTGVRDAIWSEVAAGSPVNSFRRNLQRAHLDVLINLLIKPADGTPHDAVTLARANLAELKEKIDGALGGGGRRGLDYTTKAHLEETRARIEAALTAQVSRGL